MIGTPSGSAAQSEGASGFVEASSSEEASTFVEAFRWEKASASASFHEPTSADSTPAPQTGVPA